MLNGPRVLGREMDNRPPPLHVEIALHVGKCGGITIRPATRRDVAEALRVFREVGNGDVVHRRAGLLPRSLRKFRHSTRLNCAFSETPTVSSRIDARGVAAEVTRRKCFSPKTRLLTSATIP